MLLQSLRQLITLKASQGGKTGAADSMGGHLPTVMALLIEQCDADDEGAARGREMPPP